MLIKVEIPEGCPTQGITPERVTQAVRRAVGELASGDWRVELAGPIGTCGGAGRALELLREENRTYEVTYRVVVAPEAVKVPRGAKPGEVDQHYLAAAERLINTGHAQVLKEERTQQASTVIDFVYGEEVVAWVLPSPVAASVEAV
jgi:hypothetical protein